MIKLIHKQLIIIYQAATLVVILLLFLKNPVTYLSVSIYVYKFTLLNRHILNALFLISLSLITNVMSIYGIFLF